MWGINSKEVERIISLQVNRLLHTSSLIAALFAITAIISLRCSQCQRVPDTT